MRWTERQRVMLREMGIEIWSRSLPEGAAAQAPAEPAATGPTEGADQHPVRAAAVAVAPFSDAATAPGASRGPVASASDWDALRQAAASCACGRLGGAGLGSGHRSAHWMLIGDAPQGSADGSDGFSGPAGVLLDNMLRALGLTRADAAPSRQVYVASVAPCASAAAPDEPPRCADVLLQQVQLVQPRVILAMGRGAAQSLLRCSQPLGQLRGRLHRHRGIPLICTYHPAYLLRNPEDKARAWDDLCLALQALQAPA